MIFPTEGPAARPNLIGMARALWAVCVLAAAWTSAAHAQPEPASDIDRKVERVVDRIIKRKMRAHDIPGFVVGVVHDGKLVLKKGYGTKVRGRDEPPDEHTAFAIGSVSKAVTAFGAMRLIDEGRVQLDDPLGRYLPALPEPLGEITVRQVMTHTSGLPEPPGAFTWEAFVTRARGKPLEFRPGSRQKYENINFGVVGRLIEVTSGMPYAEYMERRVYQPIGMRSTGDVRYLRGNHATGYRGEDGETVQVRPNVKHFGIPSGGLVSNLADMLRWDEAMREGRFLKPETYVQMWTRTIPPGDNHRWHFTPGWQARMAGDDLLIAKDGMVAGFTTMYQIIPGRRISLIMMSNRSGKHVGVWNEADEILFEAFDVPKTAGEHPSNPMPD